MPQWPGRLPIIYLYITYILAIESVKVPHKTWPNIGIYFLAVVTLSGYPLSVLKLQILSADIIIWYPTSLFCTYMLMSRIRGVVANYLASQARDTGIDSHQHLKDSWHIWRHLRRDAVFSCNLRFRLIFLHGCSLTYCVASLRAGPVGRISYNLYFVCKHVRSVTCGLINEYTVK